MYTDYFLDSENLPSDVVHEISELDKSDKFYIFYSNTSQKPTYEILHKIINAKCKVEFIECKNGTPNSMDFKIVSFIGLKVGSYKNMKHNKHHYVILSNDKGYDTTIEYYRSMNISMERWGNLLPVLKEDVLKQRQENEKIQKDKKNKKKEDERMKIRAVLSSQTMYDTLIREAIHKSANLSDFHVLLQKSNNQYIKKHCTLLYYEYKAHYKEIKQS